MRGGRVSRYGSRRILRCSCSPERWKLAAPRRLAREHTTSRSTAGNHQLNLFLEVVGLSGRPRFSPELTATVNRERFPRDKAPA
jgi:hypothetical protein